MGNRSCQLSAISHQLDGVRSVLVAVLLLMFLVAGCTTQAQRRVEAEQHWNQVRARVKYQLATQQFEHGQIEAAVASVTEAIAAENSSADQYLLLAHCHLEQGQLAAARLALGEAERCAPQSPEVEYTLGLLAERTDQLEVALDHYRRARTLNDSVVDYLVAEAECLVALGRTEEALVLVNANLDRFDSDGTLELLLAHIALLLDDKEMAVHNLRLAMERSGCGSPSAAANGCAGLLEECGRLLSETGRYAEAVALLRPYLEAQREVSPSLVLALGAAYLATDRVDEAKRLLREELQHHPNLAEGWMLLARTALMTGDWMTTRRCADQLARLAPRSAPTFLLQGFVCWKQSDLRAAEEALRKAVSLDPHDRVAHDLLERVLEESGHAPAAPAPDRRALHDDLDMKAGDG